ncbi:Haloacid dehalogenase-like hydrolase domain-containing protein 3, partial [Dimargaris cristalligena]
ATEIRKLGLPVTNEEVEVAFRKTYHKYTQLYPNYGYNQHMGSKRWWTNLVRDTFKRVGLARKERASNAVFELFATARPYRVFPECQRVLTELKQRNIAVGVVSNSDERTGELIQALGLGQWTDFILVSATFGFEKPAPQIFQEALRLGHSAPENTLHVGDHRENDYLAPKRLAMHSLLLDRRCSNANRTPGVINNLEQIFEYI